MKKIISLTLLAFFTLTSAIYAANYLDAAHEGKAKIRVYINSNDDELKGYVMKEFRNISDVELVATEAGAQIVVVLMNLDQHLENNNRIIGYTTSTVIYMNWNDGSMTHKELLDQTLYSYDPNGRADFAQRLVAMIDAKNLEKFRSVIEKSIKNE